MYILNIQLLALLPNIVHNYYKMSYVKPIFNYQMNINDSAFPSFNEFINNKIINEKKMSLYLNKIENTDITPLKQDMKLLTNEITIEWTRNWIYDMINKEINFPQFMYIDMYHMRDYGLNNTGPFDFYIGYYPHDISGKFGPYYIAAIKLDPKNRIFDTTIIVQNPNYIFNYNDRYLVDFKMDLLLICKSSGVNFRYDKLKNLLNQRYYYTWIYDM